MADDLRLELHSEFHARPSLIIDENAHVFHLAWPGHFDVKANLQNVFGRSAPDQPGDRYGLHEIDGIRIKWERHTEFYTVTIAGGAGVSFETVAALTARIQAQLPGQLIAYVHLEVLTPDNWQNRLTETIKTSYVASAIGGGDAEVWSDFEIRPEFYSKIVLVNRDLNPARTGRMVRRLLEIETYRMMALLGLPQARSVFATVDRVSHKLGALQERMNASETNDQKALLHDLIALSADVAALGLKCRERFSATLAYDRLVAQRIAELRETHVHGHQRFGTFIEQRFRPAMRTCEAATKRLNQLEMQIAQVNDLVRTRVQIDLSEQNRSILAGVDGRLKAQLHLQQTVEGLSVVAISYYSIGIFKYISDSFQFALGDDAIHILNRISIPLIPLIVFLLLRRVKRNLVD